MKITYCDVCFKTKKIYRESTYRIRWSSNFGKLGLDVCDEHKDFFEVCETYEQAEKKIWEMNKINKVNK